MKKFLLLILLVAISFGLSACGMTNDEIINETKKCKDVGMEAFQTINVADYSVHAVTCQ